MPAPRFVEQLQGEDISIEDILLDPNNPRLLTGSTAPVPDERIAEPQIQRRTLQRLDDGPFDLGRMRASIARSGLMPIDRIVVRPVDEAPGKYVVVEGNRRIAAVKQVLEQHTDGELTLDESILSTLRAPSVLVLQEHDEETARTDQWVIQGVRHISGVRPWGAYQVAKTIEAMTEDLGYDVQQVADALTITAGRVRRALRVLHALEQMREDDEYGDQAQPPLFAYFDEAIRSVKVRDFLGWNAETNTFEHDDHRGWFYSWITEDEEFDTPRPRIASPEGVRRLPDIVDSPDALEMLNRPGTDIETAYASLNIVTEPEWRPPVRRALLALEAIPIGTLEELAIEDRDLIRTLRDLAGRRLQQAVTLGGAGTAGASAADEQAPDSDSAADSQPAGE